MEIIELTNEAQEHAKLVLERTLAKEPDKQYTGLRIAVVGGGCSGLQYRLGFSTPEESDAVHEYENGLSVIIDEKSALHLLGARLEFHDGLESSGFEVVNPNASSTCGCGKSFT